MMKWKWSGTPGEDLHDALRWAARTLKPVSYLEIGVDGGGSLRTVLSTHVPADVVLIDPYNVNHAGHGFTNFDHIKPLLRGVGVTTWRCCQSSSQELLPKLSGKFTLITVDGDHDTSAAAYDLVNCWGLLNPGGMLVFDDCGHANYPGLKKVLDVFLASAKDSVLIEEEGAPYRNCAIIQKQP